MSHAEAQQLKALYVATALYFGQEIPDVALKAYVEDLADLPFRQVSDALIALRRDPKTTRCPLPSAIRARLTPEADPESEAAVIASRIVGVIQRVGPYDTARARELLGETAWNLVTLEGGWEHVCQTVTFDNLGTLKAQWRNLARALIVRGDTGAITPRLESQRGEQGLQSLGDVMKRLEQRKGDSK